MYIYTVTIIHINIFMYIHMYIYIYNNQGGCLCAGRKKRERVRDWNTYMQEVIFDLK